MKSIKQAVVLFASIVLGLAYAYDLDDHVMKVLEIANNDTLRTEYNKRIEYLLSVEPNYFDYAPFLLRESPFTCDTTKSDETPTSVHRLRPGDIRIVAAVGDSITAALGAEAKTLFGMLYEYRGRSWSMGGMESLESVVSMPNILRKFNPEVYGYNKKEDVSFVYTKGVGFNRAISGSLSSNIPGKFTFIQLL
jgi:hypothetical protein